MGNDTLMGLAENCFEKRRPLGQMMHRKTLDWFRQYMIVGGMPQTVQEYTETKDFDKVDQIKRDILTLYRADIGKYAVGYERKVESIFDEILAQLNKHEKKFRLASIRKDARMREYEDVFA